MCVCLYVQCLESWLPNLTYKGNEKDFFTGYVISVSFTDADNSLRGWKITHRFQRFKELQSQVCIRSNNMILQRDDIYPCSSFELYSDSLYVYVIVETLRSYCFKKHPPCCVRCQVARFGSHVPVQAAFPMDTAAMKLFGINDSVRNDRMNALDKWLREVRRCVWVCVLGWGDLAL